MARTTPGAQLIKGTERNDDQNRGYQNDRRELKHRIETADCRQVFHIANSADAEFQQVTIR